MASDRVRGNRSKKTVILDSNAILMLFEFSIDLEDELTKLVGNYDIIIPRPVYKELEFLSKNGKGKKRTNAKASLKLIEKYKIIDIDGKNADDSIFSFAKKSNSLVLTNDRDLRCRLKKIGTHVIFLRSKNKLMMD